MLEKHQDEQHKLEEELRRLKSENYLYVYIFK